MPRRAQSHVEWLLVIGLVLIAAVSGVRAVGARIRCAMKAVCGATQ
jgi:hypothetical protein